MFKLSRQIDIVALSAFLLSLSAISAQVLSLIYGASPLILKPASIVLHTETSPSGFQHLAITAPVAYLNNGAPNSQYVVQTQYARLKSDSLKIILSASHYVKTNSIDSQYINEAIESALPFVVRDNSAMSRKIKYLPRLKRCHDGTQSDCNQAENFITLQDFLNKTSNSKAIVIIFGFLDERSERFQETCQVDFDDAERIGLIENGWVSIDCSNSQFLTLE